MVGKNFSSCDLLALYLYNILVRVYFGVVRHSYRRYYHTHIHRKLLTEHYHTVDKMTAALFVYKMQKAVAELHLYLFNIQQLEYIVNIPVVVIVRGRLILHLCKRFTFSLSGKSRLFLRL